MGGYNQLRVGYLGGLCLAHEINHILYTRFLPLNIRELFGPWTTAAAAIVG